MDRIVDDATAAELRRLEMLLMDPGIRRKREQVDALLHEDFVEFGASGRVWTRDAILELLATGDYTAPHVEEFACAALASHLVLVTYRAIHTQDQQLHTATLRSSIWVLESGTWKIRFHQGTRAS
jgi:hypothetical protein